MTRQMHLPFGARRDLRLEPFIKSACNAEALRWFARDMSWPGGALVLTGPEGSGKSHLAVQWAGRSDARIIYPGDAPPPLSASQALVIEDAGDWPHAEALFHLLNQAQAGERPLLLTSRQRPSAWLAALPDLRSRLNALPVAEIREPDDELLAAVLAALFAERFIRPAPDLIPYLLRRMERSFAAAQDIVARLDQAGASQGREINRALAVRELEVANVINDLFDDRV